jgi:SAM-dependent methyltransferase
MRSTIARLLFLAGRMAERLSRTMVYLGAGTRRLKEMQADNVRAWDAFYDTHRSVELRLLPWEDAFLSRFIQPGAEVLLVGCGSGRDLLPLIENYRCRVTGIDSSTGGLALAERHLSERGLSATLIHGFFEETSIAETFDLVIFSYYSYAAIPMVRRRVAALRKAAALLKPAGHIVVSHASVVARPRAILVRLGRIAGVLTRSDWSVERGDVITDNRDDRPSFSFTHAFKDGELEEEAAAANLRVVFRQVADDNTIVAAFERA